METSCRFPDVQGRQERRNSPLSCRPISLTSCKANVLENILNIRFLKYLQSNSLLFQHQSGFLPCHFTVTQLFLSVKWQEALDTGDHVQAAFLDLRKAYDRVAIPGLINKLSSLLYIPLLQVPENSKLVKVFFLALIGSSQDAATKNCDLTRFVLLICTGNFLRGRDVILAPLFSCHLAGPA